MGKQQGDRNLPHISHIAITGTVAQKLKKQNMCLKTNSYNDQITVSSTDNNKKEEVKSNVFKSNRSNLVIKDKFTVTYD